jgi:hypothetical protein
MTSPLVRRLLGWAIPVIAVATAFAFLAWERTSSLVTPATLRRWHQELIRRKWTQPDRVTPKWAVSQQTPLLVWCLSKENPLWGYRCIQAELLKVVIEYPPGHRPEETARSQTRQLEQVHADSGGIDRRL